MATRNILKIQSAFRGSDALRTETVRAPVKPYTIPILENRTLAHRLSICYFTGDG
jgi:hypothetical protein